MLNNRLNEKVRVDGAVVTEDTITLITNVGGKWYATRATGVENSTRIERIGVNIIDTECSDNKPNNTSKAIKARAMGIVTILLILVIGAGITIINKNAMVINVAIALGLDAILWNGSILNYFCDIWINIGDRTTRELRSAIKKTLNAYRNLDVVPNKQTAQEYSPYIEDVYVYNNTNSSSIGLVTLVIMFVLGWIKFFELKPEEMLLVYFIVLFVYWAIYNTRVDKYLNWYMFKEPANYEVAMAIRVLEEHENFINLLLENEKVENQEILDQIENMTIEQATTI